MNSTLVNPEKWLHDPNYPIRILYDDGEYSVIWGKYEGTPALGARWNGPGVERGHPGQGSYPTWFVEPDFLAGPILKEILYLTVNSSDRSRLSDIEFAIQELEQKIMAAQQI